MGVVPRFSIVPASAVRDVPRVLASLQSLLDNGRLAGTGYVSILPVDQGIEHSAGASFAPNPDYFDPENIVKLAIEGGCNAVASTLGVLGAVSRKYAHKIPFVVKLNHNEFLSYPNKYDQIMFAQVEQAYWNLVFALRNLQVQIDAVKQARTQLESNQRLVAKGVLAPIDIVAAETQVANLELAVYDALEVVNRAENVLKNLISENKNDAIWSESLVPTDTVALDA